MIDDVEKAARLQWRTFVFIYRWIFRPTVQAMVFVVRRVLVPMLRIYYRWFLVPVFWLLKWYLQALWWLAGAWHNLSRPFRIAWRRTVTPVRSFLRSF